MHVPLEPLQSFCTNSTQFWCWGKTGLSWLNLIFQKNRIEPAQSDFGGHETLKTVSIDIPGL